MTFEELQKEVLEWADNRGILESGDPKTQCLKFVSEAGELCDNIAKTNFYSARDDIGDVLVTIIILSKMTNNDPVACLAEALGVISRRKGVMTNGVFVKAEE